MTDPPRLRPGLRFSRHEHEGVVSYVVKNPAALKYYRFGQVEAWLMQRMDGARTLPQICDELRDEIGMNASPQALDVLVRRLREMGLVERSVEERSALLLERVRQQRRLRSHAKGSMLRMRFSAGDPDPLLATMVERMPFFWTPGFVAASFIVFLVYATLLAANWSGFMSSVAVLYSPLQMTIGVFLICYFSFAITAIIHEFGHGLTCKRNGGEVHEMGAMLLYFMPAFYCNVSDAWTFEKRSQRLWVTLAGGWIQLWVAAAAAIVWTITEPGTLINGIGLYTTVLAGGYSVLLNYNPLIPLDGYYALVDLINMPNLRARSFAYVGAAAKRHILRLGSPLPAVTDRERRIFLTYGILSITYSTIILSTIALLLGRFMGARLGAWGWLLFALVVLRITRRLRAGAVRMIRVVAAEHLPHHRRARIAAGAAAILLVLVGLASVTPWTPYVRGSATVHPVSRHWLRAPYEARLAELVVREGDRVHAGTVIAVLRDPALDIERAQLQATVHELGAYANAARATRDAAAARLAEIVADAQSARLALLEQHGAALVLRASSAGVVVTPRLEERIGEVLAAGDSLVELWADGVLHAHIRVPQSYASGIDVGAYVRIRFPNAPGRSWHARVERIEPAATEEGLVAFAVLPADAAARLRPGMQGKARVAIARTTVAGAILRAARRGVRGDLFL
jgi:putative peptide zinc metalloprotease protein